MSGLLDLFVAPAESHPARPRTREAAWVGPSPAAAVLGGAGDARAVARLLVAELRGHGRAQCALVAEWHPEGTGLAGVRGGVAPAASRRLAASLAGRGLAAAPAGRTVRCALPGEPGEAAAAWSRALAAAACPAVLAVTGPRPPAFDGLLDDLDLIVIVRPEDADPDITALAVAGLATLRPPVAITAPPPPGAALLPATGARFLSADVTTLVRGLA
ncbi:MAG TPA: hypothetical protein VF533_04890 [Solirubrobacteraceae bacterium]